METKQLFYRGVFIKVVIIPNIPPSFIIGGQEIQLLNTIRELKELGCEIRYFDFNDSNMLGWADVFHIFGIHNHHLGCAIAELKPMVVSPIVYNSDFLKKIYIKGLGYFPKTLPFGVKKLFFHAKAIFPNSEAEACQLQNLYQAPKNRISVIPNAVEKKMKGKKNIQKLKELAPMVDENEPFILSVHRIEKRKNTLSLVRAMKSLPHIKCLLVGPIGRTEKEYTDQVQLEILNSTNVFHLGSFSQEDISILMAHAHVHVLPSFLETPGLASLEAGLNGCNLVVGDCLPVKEYFDSIAWICSQNPQSIQKNIKKAISLPRNYFGQSSQIEKFYTWNNVAKKTLSIYEKCLSECLGE